MPRHPIAVLAVSVIAAVAVSVIAAVAGCSGGGAATHPSPAKPVPTWALDGLLLNAGDINAILGTTAMTPSQSFNQMRDHSNLLPNLNCLGIWDIGEKAIYGSSGFTAVRGQALRQPDTAQWDHFVVEAVVSFASAAPAQAFFRQSADRWSHCSNHHVNMTENDHPFTAWTFGNLSVSATEITMPLTRGGDPGRPCQRSLAVDSNVIIDVATCGQGVTDQASSIVDKIRSRIPAAG